MGCVSLSLREEIVTAILSLEDGSKHDLKNKVTHVSMKSCDMYTLQCEKSLASVVLLKTKFYHLS